MDELTKLKKEIELRKAYMDGLPFCPDHRDKVKGMCCRQCEIERLKRIIRRVIAGNWCVTDLQESIGEI